MRRAAEPGAGEGTGMRRSASICSAVMNEQRSETIIDRLAVSAHRLVTSSRSRDGANCLSVLKLSATYLQVADSLSDTSLPLSGQVSHSDPDFTSHWRR